jgi:hypothetical protein
MDFNLTRPDDVDRIPGAIGYCLKSFCPVVDFPAGVVQYKRFLLWPDYNAIIVYVFYLAIVVVFGLRGAVPPAMKQLLQRATYFLTDKSPDVLEALPPFSSLTQQVD